MPRLPRVAATTSTLSTAVFSQLASRAAALQAQGRTIYPLHVGDTWMEPPIEARAESQRTEDHPGLHQYAPVQGMPTLLDAIGRRLERLGRTVPRERLQVVNGATSGLSIVAEALLDPGDEVLLPSPFWPLIRGILADAAQFQCRSRSGIGSTHSTSSRPSKPRSPRAPPRST